jgi:uncharacterized protein (TIGR03083 family)
MTEPTWPTTKADFMRRFDESWSRLEQKVSQYDAEQMVVPTDAAGWNVRDHLAHLCAWEHSILAFLAKEHEWDGIGLTEEEFKLDDFDVQNEIIRQSTLNISPADVLAMLRETNQALLDAVNALPEETLNMEARKYHPDWAEKTTTATVFQVIAGDTYEAFDEHLPWIAKIVADA